MNVIRVLYYYIAFYTQTHTHTCHIFVLCGNLHACSTFYTCTIQIANKFTSSRFLWGFFSVLKVQQDAANQLHSTNKTINYIHNVNNKNCILLITLYVCVFHSAAKTLYLYTILQNCTNTTCVVCMNRQMFMFHSIVNQMLCTFVNLAWWTPIWFTFRV